MKDNKWENVDQMVRTFYMIARYGYEIRPTRIYGYQCT
jgi:hypothetical protein